MAIMTARAARCQADRLGSAYLGFVVALPLSEVLGRCVCRLVFALFFFSFDEPVVTRDEWRGR